MSYYYLKDVIECDKIFFEELQARYDYKLIALDSAIYGALKRNESSIPIYLRPGIIDIAEWVEVFEFFDGNGLTYDYKDGLVCRAHFNLPAAKGPSITFKNT